MRATIIEISLFATTLLTGLYAGIGFLGIMGFNPAIKLMTSQTFAEYWQQIDHYMGARMPIFGPALLFSLLLSIFLLITEWRTTAFWFMLLAFVILIGDVVFTMRVNLPLNKLIQNWDLNNLPGNVQEVKWKVTNAFDTRIWFMMSSFVMVMVGVWSRKFN